MAQLLPLPLTVSCFSKIQIGFTILVPVDPGSPGQRAVKRVCVCIAGQIGAHFQSTRSVPSACSSRLLFHNLELPRECGNIFTYICKAGYMLFQLL